MGSLSGGAHCHLLLTLGYARLLHTRVVEGLGHFQDARRWILQLKIVA